MHMKQKLKTGCVSFIVVLAAFTIFTSLLIGALNLYWRVATPKVEPERFIGTTWHYDFLPIPGSKIIFNDTETFTYTYLSIAGGEYGYTGTSDGRWSIRNDNSIELMWDEYPPDDRNHITTATLSGPFGNVLQIEGDISVQSDQVITQMDSRFYLENWQAWMFVVPCGAPLVFLSVLILLLFAGFSWYKREDKASETIVSDE